MGTAPGNAAQAVAFAGMKAALSWVRGSISLPLPGLGGTEASPKKDFWAVVSSDVLDVPPALGLFAVPVAPGMEYLGPGVVNWAMIGPRGR